MRPTEPKQTQPWINVAIVAPVWLQNALMVLLHAEQDLRLIACTATVQVLLSLDLEQTPELVILETDEQVEKSEVQIGRIKTAWPASGCLALIKEKRQKPLVRVAGADEILLQGATSEQLLKAIRRLRQQLKRAAPDICPEKKWPGSSAPSEAELEEDNG